MQANAPQSPDAPSESLQSPPSPQNARNPRNHRLWIPATVAVLAAVLIGWIRFQPELETNMKAWGVLSTVVVAVLLGALWFLFLSRIAWRIRLLTAAVAALALFGVSRVVGVDGTLDGTGLPRLVFGAKRGGARALKSAQDAAGLPAVPAGPSVLAGLSDVPQFFGPNRDGQAAGVVLARDWKASPPRELWRQPVGSGWSAFAVVGGRAFTQEQREQNEVVTCYDVATGRLLWSHADAAHFEQWQGGDGPRGTPTVQDGRVFALGATGILNCLDAATGKRVWSREVLSENKLENLVWGVSASPLVFEDTVVVTGGLTKGPTLLAYRVSDGEPLWKAGTDKASYASPMLATLCGRRMVLSMNASSLTGNDPKTGEELFSAPWSDDKWPKASQPVVIGQDRVFISSGYGVGCALLEIKADADGKLSATQLWKNVRMKTQFNSVSVRDGFLYGLDDGLQACVEVATGDRRWKSGRYGAGQSLLSGDLILIQSEPGAVVLAAARPEGFEELGRLQALKGKTWNHPTLAGRFLLVRNDQEMACYELPIEGAR